MTITSFTSNFDPIRRLTVLLVAWVLAVVVAMMICLAALAYQLTAQPVSDEIAIKADVVARNVGATLSHAESLGLNTAEMPGISERIGELQREIPGIAGITVQLGNVVHRAGVISGSGSSTHTPVAGRVEVVAQGDPDFARKVVAELAIDFAFILVAVVFVTLELTYAMLGRSLLQPVRRLLALVRRGPETLRPGERVPAVLLTQLPLLSSLVERASAARKAEGIRPSNTRLSHDSAEESGIDLTLRGLRLPFFLILFAEDLSRGFMPALSSGMNLAFGSVSPSIAAGLPLAVFMLCVALAQPLFAGYIERLGNRKVFVASAALAALAHTLTAVQTDLIGMSICRGTSGIAWALAFMVVQGEILNHTADKHRLGTLGVFVTVIMVSLVCAPQLGGMIADAYGEQAALAVAAALCLVALDLCRRTLSAPETQVTRTTPAPSTARSGLTKPPGNPAPDHQTTSEAGPKNLAAALLRNGQFLALVLLSAMPAKLLLVGYCFYFAPLAAAEAGYSAAMAGRLMMLYGLLMIVCMPMVTEVTRMLLKRIPRQGHHFMVSAGMVLSAAAGGLLAWVGGIFGAALAMALLGVAQAFSTTPQATAIQRVTQREIAAHGSNAVFAYYRLLERTGSALGPLAFGVLIAVLGSKTAVASIAVGSLICGIALCCIAIFSFNSSPATPHRAFT